MFEFEDETVANNVNAAWANTYFGGNKGMKIPGGGNSIGLVKHVYDYEDTNAIQGEISKAYPGSTCEFFKRKSDGKFSGMIKVDFMNETTLEHAINNKVTILNQRYQVVEFIRRTRVVKCNKCQSWGHIHRYCKNQAKCGKCSGDHETNTCSETNFKCCHCKGGHRAGSTECRVYKEKVEQFNLING